MRTLPLQSGDTSGRALNLGTGRHATTADASALSAGLGVAVQPECTSQYRAGDIRHCFADPSLARALLDFNAKVGLEDGMADLVRWRAGRQAVDRVDDATRELSRRGLTR